MRPCVFQCAFFVAVPPICACAPLCRRCCHCSRAHTHARARQHSDDISFVRGVLLAAGVADAARLVQPRLLAVAVGGSGGGAGAPPERFTFEEVPLSTLSLWPTRLLVLDHHTHVFVWVGSAVPGARRARARLRSVGVLEWAARHMLSFCLCVCMCVCMCVCVCACA
jgi:hypothetical protein